MDSPNADWSNDQVFEFLELYRQEEALWNSVNKYHKNKNVLADSWERIRRGMCIEGITVADLKKKKESLMTTYRYHLRKVKNSIKSGAGAHEIYETNWFAYQVMHSFLKNNYDCKSTIKTENLQESNETSTNELHTHTTHTQPEQQPQQQIRQETTGHQGQQQTQRKIDKKTSSAPNLELQQVKQQMNNAYEVMTEAAKRHEMDETDYFCNMLAKKLKRMNDTERDKLMYDIHALTYQTIYNYSPRPSTGLSNASSSTYNDQIQTTSPYNQVPNNDVSNNYVDLYNYGASTSNSYTFIPPPNNQSSVLEKKQITILSQDIIQQAYQLAEEDKANDIDEE